MFLKEGSGLHSVPVVKKWVSKSNVVALHAYAANPTSKETQTTSVQQGKATMETDVIFCCPLPFHTSVINHMKLIFHPQKSG